MASDAFERASRRLERPSEALLAEMIMRDAALRQEAAAGGLVFGNMLTLKCWVYIRSHQLHLRERYTVNVEASVGYCTAQSTA